ncbi:hypothetical protein FM076_31245 [Streptomyces albus subsp. chlorinus]|nr:hypothetical protein [Streptomyces albus subsp. chlorinus]
MPPPGPGGPVDAAPEAEPLGAGGEAASVEFDEAFIRAAQVAEPAARTRELAARWASEGFPEREPWRADEPPAGWFWSRGRQTGGGRRGRLRRRPRLCWPWRRKRGD